MGPHSLLSLTGSQTDVWLAAPAEITDEVLLARYRELMSDDERAQALRFRFEPDRHRHLVTRALVRSVLSRYAPVRPEDWQFERNAYGKPAIRNLGEACRSLSFNVSHTDDLVACAVTRDAALGIDVENMERRRIAFDQIAAHFFAPEELAEIQSVAPSSQRERFFQHWTLKESYLKACGMGLAIPLDQFALSLTQPASIRLSTAPALGDAAQHWQFWLFGPSKWHVLAVCRARSSHEGDPPSVRKVVPLGPEGTRC